MPTYEYRCKSCGHEFEQFQSIKAKPLTRCPQCEKPAMQRLIGRGGGILFKGSGFYETDYRSAAYKKAAAAETQATTGKGDKDSASKPQQAAPADAKKPKTSAAGTCKVAGGKSNSRAE